MCCGEEAAVYDPEARKDIEREIAGRTLCDVFHQTAAQYPQRPALGIQREDGGWRLLSWKDYADAVRAFAVGVLSLNVPWGSFAIIL
jgi:long-chain acyl-CoA synthetase